jgi:hypothetical protein
MAFSPVPLALSYRQLYNIQYIGFYSGIDLEDYICWDAH